MPDRGFERRIGDRQSARARECTHQNGIDDATRFLGSLVHVEQDLRPAALLYCPQQAADIEATVTHRHALTDGQHAMGRGDQGRALRRHKAVEDHAARFQQLGGQGHIDLADRRVERQHRGPLARRRHDLEIIGRGAGPLRHARDLRRLDAQPLALRGGHDPVAQHTAAISAQGADQDRNRPAHARFSRRISTSRSTKRHSGEARSLASSSSKRGSSAGENSNQVRKSKTAPTWSRQCTS